MCMSVLQACVPQARMALKSWDWGYAWLWAIMWVLATEPAPSAKAAKLLTAK